MDGDGFADGFDGKVVGDDGGDAAAGDPLQEQGLLEVCPSSPGSVVALTVLCAGTALDSWPPSPPPRLLQQVI